MMASSLAEKFAALPTFRQASILDQLSERECKELLYCWHFWARKNQLPPDSEDWFVWLVLAGRGFGKTRMGSEWIRSHVEGCTPFAAPANAPKRIALIAETAMDAREVMLEGDSGLLNICQPEFRPVYEATRRRLVWPNGIIASIYSANEPDQLRGPQHSLAWGDELAKWQRAEEVWSNLLMGLRLGARPRVMITTTPKPLNILRQLVVDPDVKITKGSTYENAANLSPRFLKQMNKRYAGTQIGRQELSGDLLDDVLGALWTRKNIEESRLRSAEEFDRVVVAVDPPVTSGEKADACGIIVVGAKGGHAFVLADYSCQGLRPQGWAEKVLRAYMVHEADRVIAEVNNGGELVEHIIRQIDPMVSYSAVRASRGKMVRAEPVAALYEQGRVHHVGVFKELEDELCRYTGDRAEKSPDRLDALVWGVSELLMGVQTAPKLRKL